MIYICIPAHNEEQTVGVVLWKIRQVMADFPRDYQLLVVDDASTDKTPEVLAPYARVLPLTVVRTEVRQGEGAATEMMLREAVRRSQYPRRDIIVTLQADFTQEPDELLTLIKKMEAGADVVVGQVTPDPKAPRAVRWGRALARRLLGGGRIPEGVRDPFTSYRAYRVAAVKKALDERPGRLVHWSGWAGAAELLLVTSPHARRVETVDLVERRERLQRESRLEPWPALKAVWSLARESRPLAVATPAELDEAMRVIAAERTSEVTAAAQRGARTQRGGSGRSGREERTGRSGARREAGRSREGEAGRERRPRGGRAQTDATGRSAGRERRPSEEGRPKAERPPREGRPPRERRPRPESSPRPATEPVPPAAVAAENGADPLLELLDAQLPLEGIEPGAPAGGAKRKRKRPRRRKKSGGGAAETAAAAEGESPELPMETVLAAAPETGNGVESGAPESEGAQKSRRRRRGRRGGRRRNNAGAAGVAEAGVESTPEENAGPGAEAAPPPSEERTDDA